jgi:hypothetical protein
MEAQPESLIAAISAPSPPPHPRFELAKFLYSCKCVLCMFVVAPARAHLSQLTSSLLSPPGFTRWHCCPANFCNIWSEYCFIHVCVMVCIPHAGRADAYTEMSMGLWGSSVLTVRHVLLACSVYTEPIHGNVPCTSFFLSRYSRCFHPKSDLISPERLLRMYVVLSRATV